MKVSRVDRYTLIRFTHVHIANKFVESTTTHLL